MCAFKQWMRQGAMKMAKTGYFSGLVQRSSIIGSCLITVVISRSVAVEAVLLSTKHLG